MAAVKEWWRASGKEPLSLVYIVYTEGHGLLIPSFSTTLYSRRIKTVRTWKVTFDPVLIKF